MRINEHQFSHAESQSKNVDCALSRLIGSRFPFDFVQGMRGSERAAIALSHPRTRVSIYWRVVLCCYVQLPLIGFRFPLPGVRSHIDVTHAEISGHIAGTTAPLFASLQA